jgi:uncharacterized protein HemX
MTESAQHAEPAEQLEPATPTEPTEQPEPETAPEEPDETTAALAPVPSGSRYRRILVAAAAVLLLAFGVTMTVLYQREASARAARDRAVAARDAQLAAIRAQLGQLQTQSSDLQAKLKGAQDKQLDPAGYEQIKKCVQETAMEEQVIAKILSDPNFLKGDPPNGSGIITIPNRGDFKPVTTCTDAAKFLK